MIIFYAIGEKERAKELVRIITKTRWKTISRHAVKISSSSIGPSIVIFKPTMAALAVAIWLRDRATELGMSTSVGWFTPIAEVPEQVQDAIRTDLNKMLMKKLEIPWSP